MITRNEKELFAVGRKTGKQLMREQQRPEHRNQKRGAIVFALMGELGSGKTNFARGFAFGLGIKHRITSPTFILAKRYSIPRSRPKPYSLTAIRYFWHIDAYRLRNERDLKTIDFQNIIHNPQNTVAIEWADKIKKAVPRNARWIRFSHLSRSRRKVIIGKKKET